MIRTTQKLKIQKAEKSVLVYREMLMDKKLKYHGKYESRVLHNVPSSTNITSTRITSTPAPFTAKYPELECRK